MENTNKKKTLGFFTKILGGAVFTVGILFLLLFGAGLWRVHNEKPPKCHPDLGLSSVNRPHTIYHKILGRDPPSYCQEEKENNSKE
ncbi:MAG TPA: hypothetical protein PLX33_08935 [Alphaproteobacteria bacterium]|nr:hypothetical protein [Alphaproteobacteria bacterium]